MDLRFGFGIADVGRGYGFERGKSTVVENVCSFVAGFKGDEEFLDEDMVMEIAESWGVNPQEFAGRDDLPGLALVGLFGKLESENTD